MKLIYLFYAILPFAIMVLSAKILVVFPMPSYSHFTLGYSIVKELANRGHQVHFLNPFPEIVKIKNIFDISLEELKFEVKTKIQNDLYQFGDMSYLEQLNFVHQVNLVIVEETLKHPNFQKLLYSNETFDLLLLESFFSDGLTILQHKFQCPLIYLAPWSMSLYNNYQLGNPHQSSYIPNIVSGLASPLSFWDRCRNLWYDVIGELHRNFILLPEQNRLLRKYVKNAPDLGDILYNASFMLVASHLSLSDPIPLLPNIKEIGGYHISPPNALPENLKSYLDNSKEGVILFSMGSNLRSADIPEEKLKAILKVLKNLKQNILWKFETNLPGKPKNVKIMKWLPQNDVIAHPNIKAFIGHGGLLSTIEAVYHGVPILGIPVFWDQSLNIKTATKKGFAVSLPLKDLNEETFATAINEILNNSSYRENIKTRSIIMRSEPMKPLNSAIFWMEYVIRFKGAPHLRSHGLDLYWYQKLHIDVIFVFLLISSLFITISYYFVKKLHSFRITYECFSQTHKIKDS